MIEPISFLRPSDYNHLIDIALSEDLGGNIDIVGDITSSWTISNNRKNQAHIVSRQQGVVAGIEVAKATFKRIDPEVSFTPQVSDGTYVESGAVIVRLYGCTRSLLCAERSALNFLQHLSGIATLTNHFVQTIKGNKTHITDTRKTTPGMRRLQKWAVIQGGGVNHRLGLYDAVLIKENHATACGGVENAIKHAREKSISKNKQVPIFVEAETIDEVERLIHLKPDRIMLDNMDTDTLRICVEKIRTKDPSIVIEATGGYNISNIKLVAEIGVDLISIGSLTHSAPCFDLSLILES